MNHTDIRLLQSIQGYPALSILTPTHRTHPENQQDPTRVKNLVNQAVERLLKEFSKRDLEPLLVRLDNLTQEIDYEHTLDGLAIFVNQDFGRVVNLPFPVKERIAVDQTFATRDLVFSLNRSPRYWALVLSEQPTRLYAGLRDSLTEVMAEEFPMEHKGPGGATRLPGGQGVSRSATRDQHALQFFRKVDSAFGKVWATDKLPLAIVGVDRNVAYFNEVTSHKDQVIAALSGSHDETSPHKLAKLLWPPVQEGFANRRKAVLSELDKAVGAKRYESGIEQVWRAAQEGRGETLLVEEGFLYPATLSADGMSLTPVTDATAPDVIDDAVDELIETVLAKGGRVVFADNGVLAQHQGVALILRY